MGDFCPDRIFSSKINHKHSSLHAMIPSHRFRTRQDGSVLLEARQGHCLGDENGPFSHMVLLHGCPVCKRTECMVCALFYESPFHRRSGSVGLLKTAGVQENPETVGFVLRVVRSCPGSGGSETGRGPDLPPPPGHRR